MIIVTLAICIIFFAALVIVDVVFWVFGLIIIFTAALAIWLVLGREGIEWIITLSFGAGVVYLAVFWLLPSIQSRKAKSSPRKPPSDPIERYEWANRIGKYAEDQETN